MIGENDFPLTQGGSADGAIETNIYDIEEIYPDCTVQILRNSVTGEISIGWWENDRD